MKPRILPLEASELSESSRELLALPLKGHEQNEASDFLLTLVRHPGLYRRFAPFVGKLLVAGKLPARDRELGILRTAWLCSAPYEWGEHVNIAHGVGMSPEEVEWVTRGSTDPRWTDHERAVLRAVEDLISTSVIGHEAWTALANRYDDRQLIELPMLIGAYQMIAYVQKSLGVALRGDNAGLDAR